jgi:hypothetical protein
MTDFALCLTCPEITTGRLDSGKGWLLDASSNHHNCRVIPFTNLSDLPAPIRNVVLRLGANAPISDDDITLLKLGLNLEDQWTPNRYASTAQVAAPTSTRSSAVAPPSAASTRSQLVSPPTSTTAASESTLLDLLEESA